MPTDIVPSTLRTLIKALKATNFSTVTYYVENEVFKLLEVSNLRKDYSGELPEQLFISPETLEEINKRNGATYNVPGDKLATPELFEIALIAGFKKVAFLSVRSDAHMQGFVIVGSHDEQALNEDTFQPLVNINRLACTVLEQVSTVKLAEKSIADANAMAAITNAIKTPWDTTAFFEALHEQVKQSIGDYTFVSAL